MKPRPRVYKGSDGWVVERPGYGFGRTTTSLPFKTQRDAFASLKVGLGSAGPTAERTTTPTGSDFRWAHEHWPVEVR